MKIVGIIAEYNPLHNGHIYQLQESIKNLNPDLVIVVMSGCFTQQGNIAVIDKFTRSKLATLYGADIVIELPFVFATSSAEYFAKASINILNSLSCDYISFGSEEEDISKLVNYANKILDNQTNIDKKIKDHLKQGYSYTKAYILALEECISDIDTNLFKSNNILALEYIKEIQRLNSKIKPFCIKRIYNDYNENTLSKYAFSSATSIRSSLLEGNIEHIKNFIPEETYYKLLNENIYFNDSIYELFRYKVILNKDNLKNIHEITEGIENRIINNVVLYTNYNDFIENTLTRRFTLPKIKRIMLKILFDIDKSFLDNIDYKKDLYARILSVNSKGKKYLGDLTRNSSIPIITKVNDKVIDKLSFNQARILNKDIESTNLFDIIRNKSLNSDYKNKL